MHYPFGKQLAGRLAVAVRMTGTMLKLSRRGEMPPMTDSEAQLMLTGILAETECLGSMPLLAEEEDNAFLERRDLRLNLLSHAKDPLELDNLASVDPLDGSFSYETGGDQYAVSAGIMVNRLPTAGAVYLPEKAVLIYGGAGVKALVARDDSFGTEDLHLAQSTRETKKRVIGVDMNSGLLCPAAGQANYLDAIGALAKISHYLHSSPSACGIAEVMLGITDAYVSFGVRNWDILGGSALLLSANGHIQTFGNEEIRWDAIRMPPLIFARTEQTGAMIRWAIQNALK